MRPNGRVLIVGLLMLTVAISALACEKRVPKQSIAAGGGAATAAARTAVAEATKLSATLEAEGGSGVTGTAEFVAGSPGTKITLQVKGLPAGDHVTYIYHQSCEGSGERHGPLGAFTTEGDDSTSTTNFISLQLNHFSAERHFIVVQNGTSDNPGQGISCGEIKAP